MGRLQGSLPASGPAQTAFDAAYHAHGRYDRNPADTLPPGSEMNLGTRALRVVPVEQAAGRIGAHARAAGPRLRRPRRLAA